MLIASLLCLLLSFILLRFVVVSMTRRLAIARRVVVIGDGIRAVDLRRRLATHVSFRPSPENASRIWGVVLAEDASQDAVEALIGTMRGVPLYSDQTFQERHLRRVSLESIDSSWFLDGLHPTLMKRFVQRTFDLVTGFLLLCLALPFMALFAIAIKLDSRGPVFYRQERTGMHGEPFTLLKFRSMKVDAEVAGKPQWATKGDSRITRVGRFIRMCRIDELPQVINVLRGEMSMIGPRPERPVFVEELASLIPHYVHRGHVKPGLTGWAQVNYPYGASVDDAREKLAYDLYYIKNRTLLLDMFILMATVRVVVCGEGAR